MIVIVALVREFSRVYARCRAMFDLMSPPFSHSVKAESIAAAIQKQQLVVLLGGLGRKTPPAYVQYLATITPDNPAKYLYVIL